MHYRYFKTKEIPEHLMCSYVSNFNATFDRNFDRKYLEKKYTTTYLGYSHHVFYVVNDEVVGACTVMPQIYTYQQEKLNIGLCVGVFVHPDYRQNPLTLFEMYRVLKKELEKEGIRFVVAVPNDTVHTYWKKIVKWKDIGDLSYYVLPLSSRAFSKGILSQRYLWRGAFVLMKTLDFLLGERSQRKPISIDRDLYSNTHRYIGDYEYIITGTSKGAYTLVKEGDLMACYLIDFSNKNGQRTASALRSVLNHIPANAQCDLVIFAGTGLFYQMVMFKLPTRFHPKKLPLSIGVIDKSLMEDKEIFELSNWDFGLYNFDIR